MDKDALQDMKFQIRGSPEVSKFIQETLFDLGYSWGGQKTLQHTDAKYLICINGKLHFTNSKVHFLSDKCSMKELDTKKLYYSFAYGGGTTSGRS